jgi:hypothetical protein
MVRRGLWAPFDVLTVSAMVSDVRGELNSGIAPHPDPLPLSTLRSTQCRQAPFDWTHGLRPFDVAPFDFAQGFQHGLRPFDGAHGLRQGPSTGSIRRRSWSSTGRAGSIRRRSWFPTRPSRGEGRMRGSEFTLGGRFAFLVPGTTR